MSTRSLAHFAQSEFNLPHSPHFQFENQLWMSCLTIPKATINKIWVTIIAFTFAPVLVSSLVLCFIYVYASDVFIIFSFRFRRFSARKFLLFLLGHSENRVSLFIDSRFARFPTFFFLLTLFRLSADASIHFILRAFLYYFCITSFYFILLCNQHNLDMD